MILGDGLVCLATEVEPVDGFGDDVDISVVTGLFHDLAPRQSILEQQLYEPCEVQEMFPGVIVVDDLGRCGQVHPAP